MSLPAIAMFSQYSLQFSLLKVVHSLPNAKCKSCRDRLSSLCCVHFDWFKLRSLEKISARKRPANMTSESLYDDCDGIQEQASVFQVRLNRLRPLILIIFNTHPCVYRIIIVYLPCSK